jgi:nucleoside-diphosphate-sugar epimerase
MSSPSFAPPSSVVPPHAGAVLVTGVGHPLARRVVALAAAGPTPRVVFVVARRDELEVATALASEAGIGARVEVLEGDPASMDLGLSGQEYASIARRVERIHHLAHTADGSLDAAELREINEACAAEALELSRSSALRARLVFHSSIFTAPTEGGVAWERPCTSDEGTGDPLTAARRRAEALVWRAVGEIPLVVLRTGGVVPVPDRDRPLPSVATNPNLLGLVLVLAQDPEVRGSGSAPFAALARALSAAPLHLAPVDLVARACWLLGRRDDVLGRVLHVVPPRPASAGDVARMLRERLGPTRRLAWGRALLSTKLLESLARAPRAFVERIATSRRVDTHHASPLLELEGLVWPGPASYVEHLLQLFEDELGVHRAETSAPTIRHA